MAISRAQAQKELVPGLNKLFGLEYAKYPDEHAELYEMETSDRTFEEELKLSGFGYAQTKQEGQGVQYDTAQESYTARYTHETVTLGFAITEEAIEDNLYDSLSARYTKAMAKSMSDTKQVKSVIPFNLGFTSFNSGDGLTVFNTAHSTVYGGTNANRPSVGVDLNETAIENMWIQVANWTDERGLLIAAKPQKLVIPTTLAFVAERLLKTGTGPRTRVGTADNDISAMNSMGVFPQGSTINHRLTDTNAWFVKTDVPNGFKMFTRAPLKTSNEGDFDSGNFKYKSRERYSFGVTDYLGFWASPGST